MHIIDYMTRMAEETTDRPLPTFQNEKEFTVWRKQRQKEFQKMLGIDTYLEQPRTDLNVQVTGTLQRDTHRIDKLYFESLPGLYVTGNLYVPHTAKEEPAPALVYVCGHSTKQKVFYQEHVRRFAQLGFVVLILDTVQRGEVQGIHHGTYKHGFFNWISKGYTSTAIEVWNAIRGLDLLESLPEVDADRLGITGNSGGGAMTWWTAAADDRIKALAPSSGTGTTASHIREKTIDGHCDCMFPNNSYGWSLIEMNALVAPRPLLIASPAEDRLFAIESVRLLYDRLKDFYRDRGVEDYVALVDPPGPHGYTSDSRKAISQWLLRHLMGKEVPIEEIADFDGVKEKEEDLLVYQEGIPANDESTSVQDWFIPLAETPKIQSAKEVENIRQELIGNLRQESFATFPDEQTSQEVNIYQRSVQKNNDWYHKFSYLSEKDWRLTGNIQGIGEKNSPARTAIYLRDANDGRERANINMLDGLNETWLKTWLDLRGTGDTSWGPDLNWHVRRSLGLMGRSISSMRIWDTLQGMKAVRSLAEVDENDITLAGKGEMAVVALYAALLDGNVSTIILEDLPASLNLTSDSEGKDPSFEIINSLRYADLPTVAALLWPTKIIFVGDRPDTYRYTEEVYRQLGNPGGVWRVKAPADMRPLVK